MTVKFRQFTLLLWKNFTLKKRQWILLIMEFFLELLFTIILLILRNSVSTKHMDKLVFAKQSINTLPSYFLNTNKQRNWELVYVPSNSEAVNNLIEMVQQTLSNNLKIHGFTSEKDFEEYIKYDKDSDHVMAAVVFDHDFVHSEDPLPLEVRKYHLRFSYLLRNTSRPTRLLVIPKEDHGWCTGHLFPIYLSQGPRNPLEPDGGVPGYIREGFLAVQHAVDKAIMKYHAKESSAEILRHTTVFIKRFPFPAFLDDSFLTYLSQIWPPMILFIFSLTVFTILHTIVQEKETKLKDYLLIMGLTRWQLWGADFVTFFLTLLITISLMTFFLFIKIVKLPIIRYSDPLLVFSFLLLYGINTILFAFMLTTFFSKEVGVQWQDLKKPFSLYDNFAFGHVMVMLLVDALLYVIVIWYVEMVFLGSYSVPQSQFIFMKVGLKTYRNSISFKALKESYDGFFEPEPEHLVARIQIKNLTKVFKMGNTVKEAVRNLTLNLYEGQITALLGDNGAGKTTTLSMLTGLLPPTSGKASIYGFEITKDMVHIRKSLGFCPQHDLLFDYLTVFEHLYFFAQLKALPPDICTKEINNILDVFKMGDKKHSFPKTLSGGMKRKLSISIALVGNSKVVMLDEPTTGMDLISRRATWDLLQQKKNGRTILFTTHYMDEADLLGDRVAIMAKGDLQCCGSSLFLKQKYGAGYHMVMVKEPYCKANEVTRLIYHYVPNAILENNIGAELSFILPKEYVNRFEALFTELENHGVKLGIASFGASVTTMEEVFLQVSKLADSSVDFPANQLSSVFDSKEVETERTVDDKQQSDSLMPQDLSNIQFNTGVITLIPLCIQQFYALLLKRALYTFRHWRVMLLQILILLIFTAFVLKAILYYSEVKDAPVLEMDLQQYGQSFVPFSISGESEVAGRFAEHMRFMLRSENHILQLVSGKGFVEEFFQCIEAFTQCIVAFNLEVYRSRTIITALFNNQAYHAAPIALTVVDNIMYKSISGPTASISVFNKPQPRTADQSIKEQFLEGGKGHDIAFSLFFSIAFIASSFSLLTVSERVCKAKHIQFVSGAYIGIFWLSALFWDFIVFLVSSSLLLVVFYVCNVKAFLEDNHYVDVLFILMLFGWSTIPLMYLMSFMFSSSAAAYTRLLIFNVLTGISSFFLVYMIDANVMDLGIFNKTLVSIFFLLPTHNLAKSISGFYDNFRTQRYCNITSEDCKINNIKYEENYYGFQGHGIGKYVVAMIVTGFLFLILLFLIEAYFWTCKSLCCNFLYGCFFRKQKRIYFHCVPVVAVDKLTFKVNKGECFGLLGFNGAGKSSTLKMLTGDETITSGEAIIDGRNISTKMTEVRICQRISYCPAHNPLLEHLTGYEMLALHAHLRGVPKQYIPAYVKNIIRALLLDAFADELIKNYSGGTKRKLSTGIALLGRPDIIFLDKPSSGMDPVARRFLWDTVLRTRESGKAIVLTSHSMEECEALCSRLAIMVNGKFKCLGSPRYLKNKCGSGYTLLAKTKRHKQAEIQELKTFIKTTFPDSSLTHEHEGMVHYHIPMISSAAPKVFGILESIKDEYGLEDYSISQITLEQVFLSLQPITDTW
uniref:ABC transporter domain-containing protein n=1 Tax=Sciurus vulgaris TaxID=55149 RepID=A0A8D2E232_SCIVU